MEMEPGQWNESVLHYSGSFLQSFEWGEVQKIFGRNVFRIKTDALLGQLIEHRLPFGMRYLYVPRGPVGERSPERLGKWLNEVKKIPAAFVRVDPPNYKFQVPDYFIGTSFSIQPRLNRIIAINKKDEELLSAMHEKTRYNIRVAQRRGVEVRIRNLESRSFDIFFDLLSATAKRQKIKLHSKKYYETIVSTIPVLPNSKPQIQNFSLHHRLYVAEHEGTVLAAALVVYFGNRATYIHGGSSEEKRNVMAPYLLHWNIIRDAPGLGFSEYDLGGIDKQRWPGLTRFKRGFGGFIEEFPNSYEFPLNLPKYWLYKLTRTLKP